MLLAALLACAVRPLPPGPTPAERAAALGDPVRLVTEGDRAHLLAVIRAGSAHDPVGAEGTAWLTAQLILRGGSAQRPAPVLEAELAELDAALSVEVSRELVIFRGDAPPEHAAVLAARMGELIARPAFDEAALGPLRDEAERALAGGLSGPEALADEALDTWLNQGHPYGHPTLGRLGVLDRIDSPGLRSWHAAHYTRQATALGVAAPAAVAEPAAEALSASFAWLPEDPYRPYLAIRDDSARGRALLAVQGPPGEAALRLGLPLSVGLGDPDWWALSLAAATLGAAPSDPVRWAAAGPADLARPQAQLTVQLEPQSAEGAPFALRAAVRQLEALLDAGPDERRLDEARRALLAALDPADPLAALERRLTAALIGWPDPDRAWLEAEAVGAALDRIDLDMLHMVVVTDEPGTLVETLLEEAETPPVYGGELPDGERIDEDAEIASWPLGLTPERALITRAGGLFR